MNKTVETKKIILAYPNEPEKDLQNKKTTISVSLEKTEDSPNEWLSILYNGYEMVLPRVNWEAIQNQVQETFNKFDKK